MISHCSATSLPNSVNRINCRMNATYVKSSCASDSECFEGDLCDGSTQNQRLCIVENLDRPCLWAVQITGGEVKLQSNGIPVVPDSKSYECGGNSCNGEGVFIVKPSAGYHPAMLFQDPCCKTCTPGISVACGDTCIPEGNNCDTPPGCAC